MTTNDIYTDGETFTCQTCGKVKSSDDFSRIADDKAICSECDKCES